jgi:hypothetical protein
MGVTDETADITCGGPTPGNGSMTVTAVVASSRLNLRTFGSPFTQVHLSTGQTATVGSPVTAGSANTASILVELVEEIDELTDDPFGSFALDPSESADVDFPTPNTVEVTMLSGTTTLTVDGQTTELSEGETGQLPVDTLPFGAFTASVGIKLGRRANDDAFAVGSTFTLGSSSNGMNPVTEAVSLQVGTFSTTIPARSFRKDAKGRFAFQGVINGVNIGAAILPVGRGRFEFGAAGTRADLTGTVQPVPVQLIIGNDSGSTTAR